MCLVLLGLDVPGEVGILGGGQGAPILRRMGEGNRVGCEGVTGRRNRGCDQDVK